MNQFELKIKEEFNEDIKLDFECDDDFNIYFIKLIVKSNQFYKTWDELTDLEKKEFIAYVMFTKNDKSNKVIDFAKTYYEKCYTQEDQSLMGDHIFAMRNKYYKIVKYIKKLLSKTYMSAYYFYLSVENSEFDQEISDRLFFQI